MSVPFLIEADPGVFQSGDSATTTTTSKLTLKQISYFGRVLAKFESVAQAVDAVKASRSLLDVYVDARAIESAGDVVDVLNAGAVKALVDVTQASALLTEQQVPANRLLVFISSNEELEAAKNLLTQDHSKFNGVSVVFSPDAEPDSKSLSLSETSEVFRSFSSTYSWNKSEIEEKRLLPIFPASSLDLSSDKGFPIDLLTAGVVPDQSNGLMATVVTDERSVSLGLVWSSQESLYKALQTGTGVYQSRKRGLWYKGQSSGDVQELVRVGFDCDSDCLVFVVRQKGRGFCHLGTASCFGEYRGLSALQKTLQGRKESAPAGSYTARLFNDEKLLQSKIMEEADELCQAKSKEEIAFEAADLFYFALTRCVAAGVSLEDVERNLDFKSLKLKRRTGDAKPQWAEKVGYKPEQAKREQPQEEKEAPAPKRQRTEESSRIEMPRIVTANASDKEVDDALQRPSQKSNDAIVAIVRPIIDDVRTNGDAAVLKYTHRFEKATSLTSPVLKAPFPAELMQLDEETTKAIDVSYENIRTFHAAQQEDKPLRVETMPGVVCSRFTRAIERVGLYVPGGTAVLPSTALMLGVPAMVAGCKKIVLASPPRPDGTISPEIVYIAHKVGAESIVLAGGAQAVAAMAYGTESVSKVDKILGPGNQFVTAAKMLVSNDTSATVSIDMPAGPSEVLVVADQHANPAYVASDLLSQAEHGVDSQVVLVAVDLDEQHLVAIEDELNKQANALPRVDIVRGAIAHSVTFVVKDVKEAMELSNKYAPEHLILQLRNAEEVCKLVENAGSVFIGEWTPESVGDYSAGVNHSLPTYGYAKQYSGVNLASFVKHITASNLTQDGLRNVGGAVMRLAAVEQLDAHRRAVSIRLGLP